MGSSESAIPSKPEPVPSTKVTKPMVPIRSTVNAKAGRVHRSSSKRRMSSSRSLGGGQSLGNLPENVFFEIYQNLDAVTLATMCRVSPSWHSTINQSIRFMFSIPFQSYPTPKQLPSKTIFFTLKKLHFLDQKSCGELLFWSCARGYGAFVRHFMANIDRSASRSSAAVSLRLPFIKRHLNAVSKVDDMTSLHIAAKHNQRDIVELLLSHPTVDVNRLTKSGKHAVIIAAQRSNYEVVDQLLSHSKVNVDQHDAEQRSLLHTLCAMGDLYAVNAVLAKGADANVVDKENRSPLYIAAENGYSALCRCLLSRNSELRSQWELDRQLDASTAEPEWAVDIHLCSKSGKSPLYAAAEGGHVEAVAFLLKNGANVRQETCRGKIPLYAAAEKQYVDIVREILPFTMEQDLFKLTHYGTTAMFIASKQSNKTVKKMLIDFCSANKHRRKLPRTSGTKTIHKSDPHDPPTAATNEPLSDREEESKAESEENEWQSAVAVNHSAARMGTPKFKEQFVHQNEMKQKRRRQTFTKTTAFLERMNNLVKIADAAEEEKDPSVPRVVERDNAPKPKPRPRRRIRSRPRPQRRMSTESAVEAKEQDDGDRADTEPAADTMSEPSRPKKCAFDYNRLYRGKLRNESGDKDTEKKEDEEAVDVAAKPKKQWKGFSDRFAMRNLAANGPTKTADDDVAADQMLAIDEEEESRKQTERERVSKEAASRFLERQKERNVEAQKKAKERVDEFRNRDEKERKRLHKKREAARVLAMKVAAKIQQKERFEENLLAFSQDVEVEIEAAEQEEDAVSDPRLNLFDKMRRRGICNENFQGGDHHDDGLRLHSHRSLGTLDGIKRQKRRSLEVTGRILNVLSGMDRATKSSGGEMENERIELDMAMSGMMVDGVAEPEEDGYLFLHPLSKSKRKKMRRSKLAAAYGVAVKPKKKRRASASDGAKQNKTLDCLLQINSMNLR